MFLNAGVGSEGGGGGAETAEEKEKREKALKVVTDAAEKEAQKVFKEKASDFIGLELKSEASKALIKQIAESVLSTLEIEESNGKKSALNTIIDELQKQHDELAVKVKRFKGVIDGQVKSIMSQLKEQFDAKSNELALVHKTSSGVVNFEIKAAGDPISVGNFGDRVIFGLRESGIDKEPLPQRFIFDIIQVMNGGPGSNPLSWVEQVSVEGAPAWTAESALKPGMNWSYAEQKVTAEMIAVWTAVTRQALLNWPMLEQEIRGELSRKLYNKLDQAVINGDGTGNSIFGIDYYATAFDPGTVTKANATDMDVLRAAIGQVRKGGAIADPELGGFNPNYIIISEDAATMMDIAVNENGTYLLPPFTSADNTRIKGVPIITTNFIGDDDFIVGDFSRYLFNIVDGLKIDVGYINDQFIRNQLTIRAELYGMGRVKNHEKPAFVKGNFTDAKALLEPTT